MFFSRLLERHPLHRRRCGVDLLVASIASIALVVAATGARAQEARLIDGDTFRMGDQSYRLHGIDAPELAQQCASDGGGSWPCGRAAASHLKELLARSPLECEGRGHDDYDRIIAVCHAGGGDIGEAMVLAGMAWAFTRFSHDYTAQEASAQAQEKGIWQAPTQSAEGFRAERWLVAAQQAPEGCPIKGNISRGGRIYHTPWSRMYERTRVSLEKGELWFCSEREALDAGWRMPLYDLGSRVAR